MQYLCWHPSLNLNISAIYKIYIFALKKKYVISKYFVLNLKKKKKKEK